MGIEFSGNASMVNRLVITMDEYGAALSRAPIDMEEANQEKKTYEDQKARGKKYVSFMVIQTADGVDYRRAYFTTKEEAESHDEGDENENR